MTETVHHSAVKANVFRECTNLSGKQRDASECASQHHKCHVPNSYFEGVTLRTPLGFKENAHAELRGESVQLSVPHPKRPSRAGDPEAFQISFQLQLQNDVTLNFTTVLRIIKKKNNRQGHYSRRRSIFYLALHT